jgi:hypothetical protein
MVRGWKGGSAFPQQFNRERNGCSLLHTGFFPDFSMVSTAAIAAIAHRVIHGFSQACPLAFAGVMHRERTGLSTAGSGGFAQPVYGVSTGLSQGSSLVTVVIPGLRQVAHPRNDEN